MCEISNFIFFGTSSELSKNNEYRPCPFYNIFASDRKVHKRVILFASKKLCFWHNIVWIKNVIFGTNFLSYFSEVKFSITSIFRQNQNINLRNQNFLVKIVGLPQNFFYRLLNFLTKLIISDLNCELSPKIRFFTTSFCTAGNYNFWPKPI